VATLAVDGALASQNVTAALGALAAAAVAETVGTAVVPPAAGVAAVGAAVVASWLDSPGTAALLVGDYAQVGCGVALGAVTYASCLYVRPF